MATFVHPSSIVEGGVELGDEAFVGPFCHLRSGARLGRGVVLGQGCYVAPQVVIGDGCRVQNGVSPAAPSRTCASRARWSIVEVLS
jgi:UDP-2-acetamido-3-amino-2,3-dideoxy-glucuronate N-acetyltransferase